MGKVLDTIVKRMRKRRGEGRKPNDPLHYENIGPALRLQVTVIIGEYVGGIHRSNQISEAVLRQWFKEHYELLEIAESAGGYTAAQTVREIWNQESLDGEYLVAALEILFMVFRQEARDSVFWRAQQLAIEELNQRFASAGFGYEFDVRTAVAIRKDTEFEHKEIVVPALTLLRDAGFAGAEQEFMHAHQKIRRGKLKDSMNDAAKALESAIKTICDERGFEYDAQRDTLRRLVEVLRRNNFFPSWYQEHMNNLVALLGTAGTPRSKESAHGQGAVPRSVDLHLAQYLLSSTASTIRYLVQMHHAGQT